MAIDKVQQIVFNKVGENDHIPYSKADITKISRVSDNYAFSFYQIDYQAMAMNMAVPITAVEGTKKLSGTELLIPIGKIVLDKQAFQQFSAELMQINKAIEEEKV